ncbi:hypothetical protein DV735_g2257, partial [Chaetothyriales sp. CBS 134920]
MATSFTPGAFPADDASDQDTVVVEPSEPLSLPAAVWARRDEFTRKRTIKIKVGSWNVAAMRGTEKDLGLWEQHDSSSPQAAGGDIDLYVLGLQEVVDVSSVTEAMKTYPDPSTAQRWKTALQQVLPEGYQRVAEQQLLGLLILIYASPSLAPSISNVSCTSVATGFMGYLGNKGAVSVRLLLSGMTRVCFVNCHLAAGADKAALERRVWDTGQILGRTRFARVSLDGEEYGADERIGDEDVAFWFGDLNYRLDDIPGDDVRRLLLLHTRNQYDIVNNTRRRVDGPKGYVAADPSHDNGPPSEQQDQDHQPTKLPEAEREAEHELDPKSDPASLITTIESLLAHDQLRSLQRQRKAFHQGWREGEIDFLPTYKYDVGTVALFDSGEKKRSPSWCDRILFRTRRDRLEYEDQVKQEAAVRRKDEEMKRNGLIQEVEEHNVLFDYDPDEDGLAYGDEYDSAEEDRHDDELLQPNSKNRDEIAIDSYSSHQHVLSSDHKPLDAVFTLTYDAVVPELKTRIQQELVRDLDKAENESRPTITVVVDHHDDQSPSAGSDFNDGVHFGSVAYDVPVHRYVTIANTGQIEATARFVGKEDAGPITPGWLTISPAADGLEATLEPGDSKVIELTVRVSDGDLVRRLNNFTVELDDVLILRIDGGRDHFLPVRANWLPTCFYRSLTELALAPESGVRSISKPQTGGAATKDSIRIVHSAPRELFAFTESIMPLAERSIADWDMLHPGQTPPWSHSGEHVWPFDPSTWTFHSGPERDVYLANVRECLDTSQPLDKAAQPDEPYLVHLEVVCETLLSFLASLDGGIITASMWSAIESSLLIKNRDVATATAALDDKSAMLLGADEVQAIAMDALSSSPVHSVSMTFLIFMLANLIQQQQHISASSPIAPATMRRRQPRPSSSSSFSSSVPSETDQSERDLFSSALPPTTTGGGAVMSPTSKKRFLANLPIRRRRTDDSQSDNSTAPPDRSAAAAAAAEYEKRQEKKALLKQRVIEAFLEVAQL